MLDPPYLNTSVGQYENYFRLKEFLSLAEILINHVKNGGHFIFFSSAKSQIVEWFEFLKKYFDISFKTLGSFLNHAKHRDTDFLFHNLENSRLF